MINTMTNIKLLEHPCMKLGNTGGIYLIKCVTSGKAYVGSARNLRIRLGTHLRELKQIKHANSRMQRTANKYGLESFVVSVLEFVESPKDLLKREQFWIDSYKPKLNICLLATSRFGVKHSKETIEKIRKAKIGKPSNRKGCSLSVEHIEKLRQVKMGKPRVFRSLESKAECFRKVSEAQKGKVITQEHRGKISASLKGRTRPDLAAAAIGRTLTEEHKRNIGKAHLGMKRSAEARLKMSQHVKTEEHKANVVLAQRGKLGKLFADDVYEIRRLISCGERTGVIAKSFGVSPPTICDIKAGRTYTYLL